MARALRRARRRGDEAGAETTRCYRRQQTVVNWSAAAWTVGDNKNTVFETGLVNLTKDQAPVLVHYGKDRTQQWLLVRVEQPAAGK